MNRLLVGLVLAGLAGLVGCGAGDPTRRLRRPRPDPDRPALHPEAGHHPGLGAAPPVGNDGNFQVFEVSALQRELVAMNQHKAIKPLWDQGVRFGITDPFKSRHLVLINPGVSGLTARQILDRMFSG